MVGGIETEREGQTEGKEVKTWEVGPKDRSQEGDGWGPRQETVDVNVHVDDFISSRKRYHPIVPRHTNVGD